MRRLLAGPVLLGFADLFDAAWGCPCSPAKMPTLTPTCIGGTLLPFNCPHCGAVRPVMTDPKKRDAYRDPWRDFYWCPACQGRYRLDTVGAPLAAPILPGARAAPARVTIGGAAYLVGVQGVPGDDLDLLEAAEAA